MNVARNHHAVDALVQRIRRVTTRPHVLMEVCGVQTHSIVEHGLDRLLPAEIEMVHGPGCPVCVTSLETIDRAHAIARRANVIFCSSGDMLRVPGSESDLLVLKALGADIRTVYSPMDGLRIARENPEKEVVFFATGFETAAPANAMAVWHARRSHVRNFSILVSLALVPPMLGAVLESPGNRVEAFIGPGHICMVMGSEEYEPVAERYRVPIVLTGFEPVDLLEGILHAVTQLEEGRASVENRYRRVVNRAGSANARRLIANVFEVSERKWRGIGSIPRSGYTLGGEFLEFDASRRFEVEDVRTLESDTCQSGQVLTGRIKPPACPAFGRECTPERPLGATMVSSEGACASYYAYRRGSVRRAGAAR